MSNITRWIRLKTTTFIKPRSASSASSCSFPWKLGVWIMKVIQKRKMKVIQKKKKKRKMKAGKQGSPHLQTQLQVVPVLSSLYPSLISFSSLTFPAHPTGFSICFFPGFLAIFTLLSSNNNNNNLESWTRDITRARNQHLWIIN